MVAQTCEVGGESCNCSRLAASSPDHGGELVDALQWLALSAGQLAEDLTLIRLELLAHRCNKEYPPGPPTVARNHTEQVWI
jgi:hypothetical protein